MMVLEEIALLLSLCASFALLYGYVRACERV